MTQVIVLDQEGTRLSPCAPERAEKLLQAGRAIVVCREPLTIRLTYTVKLPPAPQPSGPGGIGSGKRLLLHICCGPCATYPVRALRAEGYAVTGHWYNPNIHPYSEHAKRREALAVFAEKVELPLIAEDGYEMPAFFRAVAGRERFRERCILCYRLRLARTAARARAEGYDAFTTTLLISPYQDQAAIRKIGEALAEEVGVAFHFENFRRGWAERGRLTREYGLYAQSYCGCLYSEWEAAQQRQPEGAG